MSLSLTIAVIEDHDFLRQSTIQLLREKGHHAHGFFCAEELADEQVDLHPDLYIIDIELPGEDGLSLAQRIRATRTNVGIIMMTARRNTPDKVQGYASGADVYLPKPVDPEELLAVVDRFATRSAQDKAALCDACFIPSKLLMERGPLQVQLSQSEANLLQAFLIAPLQILERWQVLEVLSAKGEPVSDASMEVRITLLRKKFANIGLASTSIQSIRKIGYRLCVSLISR